MLKGIAVFLVLVVIVVLIGYIAGKRKGQKGEIDKLAIYRHMLIQVNETLEKLEVPYFLSSGTCLGYARERNFIAHDRGLDIGIREEDWDPRMIKELEKRGLKLQKTVGRLTTGLTLVFEMDHTFRPLLKVFLYYTDGDKVCWKSTTGNARCVSPFELKEVHWLGVSVAIPDPLDEYLIEIYGQDWRIPK